ncbi:hypothetical protein RVR_2388 [Actinacidiphila reveromycinica]|uniref:Histidine kinase/HSP90-like ATPase domain-containing protein n=1 Tax=Actinacidiphila reveromycinica TaxID=659352 RepID=A0A7U3UMD1_9ACTN|nr:ATP-binding protein [Streptomyces sp. SN-593]BBA96885.1 hypothetical protein RVR_2388 [Streptomyces sp. SN-593]
MTTYRSTVDSPLVNASPAPTVPASEHVRDEMVLRIPDRPAEATPDHAPHGRWVGLLRHITAAKARQWALSSLVDDAALVVSELVTNAMRYGGGEFEFRLTLAEGQVVIAVTDSCTRPPKLSLVGPDSETGRGLLIVAALADMWGVSPDGRTTWCSLSPRGES